MDYSWTWAARNFYGLIETYYSGLGQNDYENAIVNPEIIERWPG